MKSTKRQAQRIIENIFDILMQTQFEKKARSGMNKDLTNKNVTLNKDNGTIDIQNFDATITQYTITIR